MRDYKVKEIHSLVRGLDVLRTLQTMQAASLHDLFLATGIPKSTLTRIIHTLSKQGYVWQRIADSAFIASYSFRFNLRECSDPNWIAEIASPHLIALCERCKWPSTLSVPRLDYLELVETNSPKSYFDDVELGPVGYRANLLRSASGRAYMSFCSGAERRAIINRLKTNPLAGNELAFDEKAIASFVDKYRAQGYALRAPDFGGHYAETRETFDDRRESLAVPIVVEGKVLCIVNITWKIHVMNIEKAVSTLLCPLQKTSADIAKDISLRLRSV